MMGDGAISNLRHWSAQALNNEFRNYIAGEWLGSRTGEQFDDVNPADTSDIVGRFPTCSAADAELAVQSAAAAFTTWRRTPGRNARHTCGSASLPICLQARLRLFSGRSPSWWHLSWAYPQSV
jgi:delta 1-pyrroline-5-carboxylate dehydrogenase